MFSFLKSFLSNEKTPAEQAMLAKNEGERQRDMLTVSAQGCADDEDEEDCAPKGGCGGCGCHR